MIACSSDNGSHTQPVTIEHVIVQKKLQAIRASATVTPSVDFALETSNDIRIEEILIQNNDRVSIGDALFRVTELNTAETIATLQKELKMQRNSLEKYTYIYHNKDRLLDEEFINQELYDSLEKKMIDDEEKITQLNQRIKNIESQLDSTIIYAPKSGRIMDITHNVLDTIKKNTIIGRIIQMNPLHIHFQLESYEAKSIEMNMPINVRILDLPDEISLGHIDFIGNALNHNQRFHVIARINNPHKSIKSGMKAKVEFTGKHAQRIFLISKDALLKENRRFYVFTVKNGIAHKVRIIPQRTRGAFIEIAKGLNENDIVVKKGHEQLTQGSMVDIWSD